MELRKQSSWSLAQPQLYYWRTASGQEVDIVLEDSAGHLVGVKVKASASLLREDFSPTKLAGALRAGSLYGAVTGRLFLPFPKVNAFDEQPDSQ